MFGEGFELFDRHGFLSAEAGWRWRGGAPADEFLLDFGTGMEPWASGLVMLQSFSIFAASGATGAYRRYDLSKLQLSVAQRLLDYLWVQAGVVGAIAGIDRGETGAVLGFWWRF